MIFPAVFGAASHPPFFGQRGSCRNSISACGKCSPTPRSPFGHFVRPGSANCTNTLKLAGPLSPIVSVISASK